MRNEANEAKDNKGAEFKTRKFVSGTLVRSSCLSGIQVGRVWCYVNWPRVQKSNGAWNHRIDGVLHVYTLEVLFCGGGSSFIAQSEPVH